MENETAGRVNSIVFIDCAALLRNKMKNKSNLVVINTNSIIIYYYVTQRVILTIR